MRNITQDEFNTVLQNAPETSLVRIENDDRFSVTAVWYGEDCVIRTHHKTEDLTKYQSMN